MKKSIFVVLAAIVLMSSVGVVGASDENVYLLKPTGRHGIGFKDFHWVDQNRCPDREYYKVDNIEKYFSPENIGHCHEVMVRIYYPTNESIRTDAAYEQFTLKANLELIEFFGSHLLINIFSWWYDLDEQLEKIKSFASKDVQVASGATFPLLLFIPGYGGSSQFYENLIAELVSHCYIVAGINIPHINPVAWPGHTDSIIIPRVSSGADYNITEAELCAMHLQVSDMRYVIDKIKALHVLNEPIFSVIDLDHIGAIGHSMGALSVGEFARHHPTVLQAMAALDIFSYCCNSSTGNHTIPHMHLISAGGYKQDIGPNKKFIVVISPDEKNDNYSQHLDFNDLSTLREVPVVKKFLQFVGGLAFSTHNNLEIINSVNIYLLSFF